MLEQLWKHFTPFVECAYCCLKTDPSLHVLLLGSGSRVLWFLPVVVLETITHHTRIVCKPSRTFMLHMHDASRASTSPARAHII